MNCIDDLNKTPISSVIAAKTLPNNLIRYFRYASVDKVVQGST